MYLLKLFSRQWILWTVAAVLMMALFVRLGFWQLDRLEQKRAYNTTLSTRWHQEPFDLSQESLPAALESLEYRRVTANGTFDYAHQIVLKSQVYRDVVGIVLVTPFVLAENRAVLVARGWVPLDRSAPQFWPELEEPAGVPLLGLLRPSQSKPGAESPGEGPSTPQAEWYRIDISAIQQQMPYQLEPVWLQQLPEPARPPDRLPIREEPTALDSGTHLAYAVQWFSFAAITGFGYILLVRFRERRLVAAPHTPRPAADADDDESADPQTPALA